MKSARKTAKACLLLSAWVPLSACDGYYQKQVGESYFIRYVDLKRTMDIGFGTNGSSEELIGPTVYEVYWNERYILAKTHPDFPDDRKRTDYYLIEKVLFGEKRARAYLVGPVTKSEYERQIKALKLTPEDMEHIVYDDLK
jgi:hypothetical protein